MEVSMARVLKCVAVKVAEKRATMTDFMLKRLANGTLKRVIESDSILLTREQSRHPSFKVKEPGARAERRRRFKEFESVSVGSACGHAQCVRADVFRHAPDTVPSTCAVFV
jgi:hypothetical protein